MTDHDQPTERDDDQPTRTPPNERGRPEQPEKHDQAVDPDAPGGAALHPLDEAPDVEPNEPA